MDEITNGEGPPARSLVKRLLPVGIIALALVAFFSFGLDAYFSLEALKANHAHLDEFVHQQGIWAIVAFIAIYALAVSISFPGASLMTIFGGFMFGTLVGGMSVVVGATIGATVIFLVAKYAAGDTLRAKVGSSMARIEAGLTEGELSYMFVLRLVPLFPFWMVNLATGLLGVKTRNYLIATFFGIIPATFVYAAAGDIGADAIRRGEDLNLEGLLLDPKVLFLLGGLVLLALIPVFYKRLRKSETLEE